MSTIRPVSAAAPCATPGEPNATAAMMAANAALGIDDAAKADARRTVAAGRHQQVLAVLVELVGLREIPVGGLRQVAAAAAQHRSARVLVVVLVGPLPHVADEVHHAERARALRMGVDVGGIRHLARPAL